MDNIVSLHDVDVRRRAYYVAYGDCFVGGKGYNTPIAGVPVSFDDAFHQFALNHPAWDTTAELENLFLFWLHFKPAQQLPNLKVIRRQESGLCCMHAPAVLQHYLLTMATMGAEHGMLDVSKYIATQRYVVEGQGQSSFQFLCQISNEKFVAHSCLIPSRKSSEMEHELAVAEIVACLRKYGPCLVAGFHVDHAFYTAKPGQSFIDVPNVNKKDLVGYHAMLIVGYREVPSGQCIFLLQNWWQDRYFIEVSSEYLASAQPHLYFCKRLQNMTTIPHAQTHTSFAESLDVPETLACEM